MDNIPQAMQDNIDYMNDNEYQIVYTYLSAKNPYNSNKRQCIVHYIDVMGNAATAQCVDGGEVYIQYISLHQLRKLYRMANKKAESFRALES